MSPTRAPRSTGAAAARRFLAIRHLLAPARILPPGPDGVLATVERLGSLQFDPLAVAGRNHDLVLHARVRDFDPGWVDDLLYGRRLLFEAYNKGLSLLPTHELPWYRITWERHAAAHADETFVTHAALVEEVLERIRREGPLASIDLGRSVTIDWYWGPTSSHRAVLEALAEAGLLGLARREGNRRYYDLIERCFPADLLAIRVGEREQLRHKLLSRYRGQGLLGATGSDELWSGIRRARQPDGTLGDGPTRAELLGDLIDAGELVPLEVEGCRGTRHVLTAELPLLAQAEREVAGGADVARPGGADPTVTFLAPLDPFVWDRGLLRQLFGFDYVWEVYVPAARRRWGYYVLPVLFGDRLVGRIEPRIDRTERSVRLLNLWWEAWFDPLEAAGFIPALAAALDAYRRFANADDIVWPSGRAVRRLARAVNATGMLGSRRRRRTGPRAASPRRRAGTSPAGMAPTGTPSTGSLPIEPTAAGAP